MTRATAPELAAAAAYGGGGLGLLGGSLYGVLKAEAQLARRRIGSATLTPPDPSGLYAAHLPGRPLRLAVLGDSAAAGYGARDPGRRSAPTSRRVSPTSPSGPSTSELVATVGAESSDLMGQIPRALASQPDICVIIIGVNDVTHRVLPSRLGAPSARRRRVLAQRAHPGRGRHLPRPRHHPADRATAPSGGSPLESPARRRADDRRGRVRRPVGVARLDPRTGVRRCTLRTCSARTASTPVPPVTQACAAAMLPTVADAVGVLPADVDEPELIRGEGCLRAVRGRCGGGQHTGTEVSAEPADSSAVAAAGRCCVAGVVTRSRRSATSSSPVSNRRTNRASSRRACARGEPDQACGKGLSGDAAMRQARSYTRLNSRAGRKPWPFTTPKRRISCWSRGSPKRPGRPLQEWFGHLEDGPGCSVSTIASSGCARSTTSRTGTPPRSCTSTICARLTAASSRANGPRDSRGPLPSCEGGLLSRLGLLTPSPRRIARIRSSST